MFVRRVAAVAMVMGNEEEEIVKGMMNNTSRI